MKRTTNFAVLALAAALTLFFATTSVFAQTEDPTPTHGPNFVDENGDGYNDNAPDHDGDGIPNGQDADWQSSGRGRQFVDEDGDGINDNAPNQDGNGLRNGLDKNWAGRNRGRGFIDEDGDGVCDMFQDADGDGIANANDPDWERPANQTGNKFSHRRGLGRRGNNGTTPEDGTGN